MKLLKLTVGLMIIVGILGMATLFTVVYYVTPEAQACRAVHLTCLDFDGGQICQTPNCTISQTIFFLRSGAYEAGLSDGCCLNLTISEPYGVNLY